MKEPSPLVPQGSFEAQAQRKSHVRIAVFSILAIHVVVLGGLLILGCKRDDKSQDTALTPPPMTNDVPPFPGGTDVVTSAYPPPLSNAVTIATNIVVPPPQPPVVVDTPVLVEHTIVKGDSFATLATKYGVSVRAIQEANPTLVPTRLKIGDKVKIPPKMVRTGTGNGIGTPPSDPDSYTVKSGDTLSKIAKDHRTTVSELQKLNGLATTQIKVGQKLKLPPNAAAAPTGGTTPPPAQ